MLPFTDNVLRECDRLEADLELWQKLDDLYIVKTLPNKIYLLKRSFSFTIDLSEKLQQNLDEFNKIILDLASCKTKFEDDQLDLILLLALLESFDNLINAIESSKDTLRKDMTSRIR